MYETFPYYFKQQVDGNQKAFIARNIRVWIGLFRVQNDLGSLGQNDIDGLIKFALHWNIKGLNSNELTQLIQSTTNTELAVKRLF